MKIGKGVPQNNDRQDSNRYPFTMDTAARRNSVGLTSIVDGGEFS